MRPSYLLFLTYHVYQELSKLRTPQYKWLVVGPTSQFLSPKSQSLSSISQIPVSLFSLSYLLSLSGGGNEAATSRAGSHDWWRSRRRGGSTLPPLLVGTEAVDDGGAAEWSGGGGTPSGFLPEPPATTASTSPFTACASGFSLFLPLAGSTAHLLPRLPDLVPGRRPPGGRRGGGGPPRQEGNDDKEDSCGPDLGSPSTSVAPVHTSPLLCGGGVGSGGWHTAGSNLLSQPWLCEDDGGWRSPSLATETSRALFPPSPFSGDECGLALTMLRNFWWRTCGSLWSLVLGLVTGKAWESLMCKVEAKWHTNALWMALREPCQNCVGSGFDCSGRVMQGLRRFDYGVHTYAVTPPARLSRAVLLPAGLVKLASQDEQTHSTDFKILPVDFHSSTIWWRMGVPCACAGPSTIGPLLHNLLCSGSLNLPLSMLFAHLLVSAFADLL